MAIFKRKKGQKRSFAMVYAAAAMGERVIRMVTGVCDFYERSKNAANRDLTFERPARVVVGR